MPPYAERLPAASGFRKAAMAVDQSPFAAINRQIDRMPVPYGVNEGAIETLSVHLDRTALANTPEYWLTAARLTELALICAGHYADHGAFSAAGDLLVNPRRVLIYRKGYQRPIVKPRHVPLSEALGLGDVPWSMRCRRLCCDTLTHVDRGPLLPELVGRLRRSRHFPQGYLDRLQGRLEQVAATIAFLSAWGIDRGETLHRRLMDASADTRELVHANLCRFTGSVMRRLGREIGHLRREPGYRSPFLVGDSPPRRMTRH